MEYTFQKDLRLDLREKMDEPGIPIGELSKAHRELRIINYFLGGYDLLIESLEEVNRFYGVKSILDVGCGSGDNLRVLADYYRVKNKDVTFTGVDINIEAISLANQYSHEYPEISYHTGDVWMDFGSADIVTCSLFCHHFSDEKIGHLLTNLIDRCNIAVVINDLHRNRFAYHAIRILTKLFSKSYLVKYDAPLSVASAFSREDWNRILSQCNFSKYTLKWRWAWRWQLIIYK